MTAPPLTPADWQQLGTLFDAALALPPHARVAWVAAQTGLAPHLQAWLCDMLTAHEARSSDDWLERGPAAPADDLQGLAAGACVGPWVLHELLGSGGMATVWRASRVDALPAREVALKLPLAWRSGSQLAERFAQEREILARLSHPHIAPLYAAGVASDGTPWLAMELVRGEPMPAWCDTRRLSVGERLALFDQVLDAVVYAHAQLVIHRDLKPSNLLVTEAGRVCLLDFGIAKLLDDGQGASTSELTRAVPPLTLAYAAPEQLLGEPLGTASDVYALGVLLFELLTGNRPYRVTLDTPAQLEQAIVAGDLRRASDCVADAAGAPRGCSAAALRRLLRGDLDSILAKAMARLPADRYASVAELADDLRRWREHEPVRAQPPSRRYRLARFVRRYRLPVLAGAVTFASLLAAVAVSWVQVQRADHQRDLALAQRGQGTATRNFLLDQLVVTARDGQVPDLASLLARTETRARAMFANSPDELAMTLFVLGGQRRSFDGAAQALPALTEAMATARDPDLRAEISCDHGAALYALGRRAEGLAQVRRAGADSRLLAGTRCSCLAYQVLLEMGEGDWAGALRTQALSTALGQTAPDVSPRARDRGDMMLAFLQGMNAQGTGAEAVFERVARGWEAARLDRSLSMVELRSRWATLKLAAGDPAGALPLIEMNRRGAEGPPVSPSLPGFLRLEGQALRALGRSEEALAAWQRGEARATQTGDPRLAASLGCLIAEARGDAAALAQARARLPAGLAATDEAPRLCALAAARLSGADVRELLADKHLPPALRTEALLLRGQRALTAGDLASARADAQASLTLAQALQDGRPHSWRVDAAQALLDQAQ